MNVLHCGATSKVKTQIFCSQEVMVRKGIHDNGSLPFDCRERICTHDRLTSAERSGSRYWRRRRHCAAKSSSGEGLTWYWSPGH